MILRYLGRLGAQAADGMAGLYGADPLAACQVDQWLETSTTVVPGQGFDGVCAAIDKYLALRSFLVGYAPSVADFAVWGALHGAHAHAHAMQAYTAPAGLRDSRACV